ncbi:helix-turn-helix domain-containing protein [Micromonospora psammae]|uniref:helix-turn-helix domain-containing protein n=1 Tax=Micromonospora sp. CPCC 205556 TaxID=3122398 RepID=UPI002FF2DAE7
MTSSLLEHDLGLSCWEGTPGVMSRAHRHQDIEINIVEEGGLAYLFGGRYVELGAGTTALFWAAIPHQVLTATPDAHVWWLNLPMDTVLSWGLDRAGLDRSLRGWPVVVPQDSSTGRFRQWSTELAGGDAELRAIALLETQAYVRRLLHARETDPPPVTQRQEDGAVGQVTTMARYAARHFAERISVADVADTVHLHPRYAMTIFRRVTGLTIGRYLEQCRVAEAERLLLTTDATVTEVAHAAGFGSVSRLYASFTAACGQSPAAYRRTYRLPPG